MYENLALSEDGFLFNTRTGHTFSLNPTGTWMLRMLIEEVPPDELPARLTEAFDVDVEVEVDSRTAVRYPPAGRIAARQGESALGTGSAFRPLLRVDLHPLLSAVCLS